MTRPKLRVASLVTDLVLGGAEARLLSFARAVDRDRIEHVVVPLFHGAPAFDARWGSLRAEFEAAGVELCDLEPEPLDRLLGPFTPAGLEKSGRRIARMMRKLTALLRARRIDVLDAQHVTASLFGIVAGRLTRTPTTVTEYDAGYWERRGYRAAGRALLRLPDALVTDSRHALDGLDRWLLRPHRRGVVVPSGVARPEPVRPREEVRRFFELPDEPGTRVVAQLARVAEHKGQATLLEAAARVLAVEPRALFLLVGFSGAEPGFAASLERRAAELGIAGRVRVRGYPGPVGDPWSLVDVHVHASHRDSAPIGILESMSLGRPAVASSVGGIPELIAHERTGLLVPPRDPVALADAILRLLRDGETARRLGDAARARWAERHTPAIMARSLEQLFEDVASAQRRGRPVRPAR